jgi:predicted Zn-dependent peptidase
VTQLENGLRIATAEMPHMASVSLGIWIGAGSRYEHDKLNGVCHFIEHLLFKGTRKRSAKEISEAVEGIGGYLNAFTSEETTCFHARACSDRFEDLLDVLVDMLLNSKFSPPDITKEREVIKEEIAMYLDEPQHQVQELLNSVLWPQQPLGRPITGTPETLDAMRRKDLVTFLRTHYNSSCTVIAAAGKVKHRQVLRAVRRYEAGFPPGARISFAPVRVDQREPRVLLFTKDTEQTQLALGFRTWSRHDDRRYALRLLNAILGENMSSRLFQVVREDRGLAYNIYSSPSFFDDTGDLVISAGLDTDNLPKTVRLIMRELRRLTDAPPTLAELRRACDYVIGQIELGQENAENQMNWIGEQLLGYGRIHFPSEIKRRLSRVTGAEIRSIARGIFQAQHFNLALVSPLKSDRALGKLLKI